MEKNWTFTDTDDKITREISDFLPDRMFDIHSHIYRVQDLNLNGESFWSQGPDVVGIRAWRDNLSKIMGKDCLTGGLFFPVPSASAEIRKQNDFLLEQLGKEPLSRGLILITPDDTKEDVIRYLDHPQICGFKVYHVYSNETPTMQSSISGFCPDWMWEVAHERKFVVMLHMVKDLAIADEENQQEIRNICTGYPGMQLILAHAARCFHAPNAVKGLMSLRGLENVWFDMSAICEAEPIIAVLKEFGPRKLMWGSDYPVSQIRGKYVTIGEGFTGINPDNLDWSQTELLGRPVLLGIESLRALKTAADDVGLNADDVSDIFYKNAARLLQLEPVPQDLTQKLYHHAKNRIPGGVQLLSKKPELMAPDRWPAYFTEAKGCEVWDLDGNHYYDMSTNAVGSCLLGYRDPDVSRAVIRRVHLGSMCSLNSPEEVELADLLCDIHPWAEQVRFARGGGESCAIAIRIARATTDRSVVAICGYHGWHDWYLSANLGDDDSLRGHLLSGLNPIGVPRELRGTTTTFKYGDREALQTIMDQYGDQLAAVIMEPCRHHEPDPGFLEFVKQTAHRSGALLIFDEVSIGWRLTYGGAHLKYGVTPDIAVFSKAMGNGHPIGAVIGTREAMQGADNSFISSTYWTESVGPVAAVATIRKLGKLQVHEHVHRAGLRIADSWRRHGSRYHLPVQVGDGFPCLANFHIHHDEAQKLRTLYTQKMLERGFLAGSAVYLTLAHDDAIIELYDAAIEQVFSELADALASGDIDGRLRGRAAISGFQRLT